MDYRDLLVRYMALIIHEESVDYLGRAGETSLRGAWFTNEQMEALEAISEEAGLISNQSRKTEDAVDLMAANEFAKEHAAKTPAD